MILLEYKSGRLSFLKNFKKGKYKMIKAKCECGNIKELREYDFKKILSTKSCGCLAKEVARNLMKIKFKKHGLRNIELYSIWKNAKERCYREKNNRFKTYGALGIQMDKAWKNDFLNFYRWALKNGYVVGLSLERKDINKNYDPENCCWIPKEIQARNTRNTFKIKTMEGYKTLKEYASYKNFSLNSLYHFVEKNNISKLISEDDFLRQYLAKTRVKTFVRCND